MTACSRSNGSAIPRRSRCCRKHWRKPDEPRWQDENTFKAIYRSVSNERRIASESFAANEGVGWPKKLNEATAKLWKAAKLRSEALLTEKQRQRIRQINVQRLGHAVFFHPEYSAVLKLDGNQREELRRSLQQHLERVKSNDVDGRKSYRQFWDEAYKTLRVKQRRAFKKLRGPPLKPAPDGKIALTAPGAVPGRRVSSLKVWSGGYSRNDNPRRWNALPERGYIVNEDEWRRVWRSWRNESTEMPSVDFTKVFIFGCAIRGPHGITPEFRLDKNGNLATRYCIGGNTGRGFYYVLVKIPRLGIKTVNFQKMPVPQ